MSTKTTLGVLNTNKLSLKTAKYHKNKDNTINMVTIELNQEIRTNWFSTEGKENNDKLSKYKPVRLLIAIPDEYKMETFNMNEYSFLLVEENDKIQCKCFKHFDTIELPTTLVLALKA